MKHALIIIAVLAFSAIGQAPQAFLVSPSNSASSVAPNPTSFSWTIASGGAPITNAACEIQVSTDSTFLTEIVYDSTISNQGSIQPTLSLRLTYSKTYFWHVRCSLGYWGNWSATNTFSTLLYPMPTVPTPLLPKGNGTIINPAFSWNSVPYATSYDVQVIMADSISPGTVNALGSNEFIAVADSFITDTSKVISLNYAFRYRWFVRARNTTGKSNWSTQTYFVTDLPVPSMLSPLNKANNISLSPTFTWSQIVVAFPISYGSFAYHIQISNNSSFSPILIEDSSLTVTSKSITGLFPSLTYYWRMRADSYGNNSTWSSAWQFTTVSGIPQTPVLVTPSNGTKWMDCTIGMFSVGWQNVQGTTYDVQIGNGDLSSIISENTAIADTHNASKTIYYYFNAAKQPSLYSWRVRAFNSGGSSTWSDTWSFSAGGTPPPPQLISPTNSAIAPVKPTLLWDIVVGGNPTQYEVQVAQSNLFTTLLCDSFVGYSAALGFSIDTTLNLSLPLGTYYWRVKTWVNNSYINSQWSPVWMFTTSNVSCKAPIGIKNRVIAKTKLEYISIRGEKLNGIIRKGVYIVNGRKIVVCNDNMKIGF